MFSRFLTRQGAHAFIVYEPDAGGGGGGGGEDDAKIPKERLDKEIAKREAAEQAKADAEAAKTKAEQDLAKAQRDAEAAKRDGLPELDKVKAELADAKEQIQALTAERDQGFEQRDDRIMSMERGAWVREAAEKAGFHDPEDAILRLDLSDIKTREKAEREVKALAGEDRYKHLVKPAEDEKRQGEVLREVLSGGKLKTGKDDDGEKIIPPEEFAKLTQDQHVELAESKPDIYNRSLAAAAEAEPAAA